MHILFLPSWYKTADNPIAGIFFEEQARLLGRFGNKVGVLFADIDMRLSSRWRSKRRQPRDFDDTGIPTYYCFSKSIFPRSRRLNFWYVAHKADRKFKLYIKEQGMPDILHAHSTISGGIVAAFLAKKYKIPFVLTEHYSGLISSSVSGIPANRFQVERVLKSSNKSIAVSNFFKEQLEHVYNIEINSISVIPNVVNDVFFSVNPSPPPLPFTFLVVASLIKVKNHELLLHAFTKLSVKFPCRLHIVGDGILKNDLVVMVGKLEISDKVSFYGTLDRTQIKNLLDNSHALVSSSKIETFGINIAEALASGKPVVVTDSGGPRDFIEPFNGVLVGEHTVEALFSGMRNVIEKYQDFDPQLISTHCKKRFSGDIVGRQLLDVYKGILDEGK